MSEELYLLDDCFLLVRDFLAVNVDVPPSSTGTLAAPLGRTTFKNVYKKRGSSSASEGHCMVRSLRNRTYICIYIYIYYVYIYAYIHYKVCMYTVIPQ